MYAIKIKFRASRNPGVEYGRQMATGESTALECVENSLKGGREKALASVTLEMSRESETEGQKELQ